MSVFVSTQTVHEIFNTELSDLDLINTPLFKNVSLKDKSNEVLDVDMMCQKKGTFLIVFSKLGYLDFYEFFLNDEVATDYQSTYVLIQSSRIDFS